MSALSGCLLSASRSQRPSMSMYKGSIPSNSNASAPVIRRPVVRPLVYRGATHVSQEHIDRGMASRARRLQRSAGTGALTAGASVTAAGRAPRLARSHQPAAVLLDDGAVELDAPAARSAAPARGHAPSQATRAALRLAPRQAVPTAFPSRTRGVIGIAGTRTHWAWRRRRIAGTRTRTAHPTIRPARGSGRSWH